jgi:hypothetical protein
MMLRYTCKQAQTTGVPVAYDTAVRKELLLVVSYLAYRTIGRTSTACTGTVRECLRYRGSNTSMTLQA